MSPTPHALLALTDRQLHLVQQKQALMHEASLMVVADAKAALVHRAELEALETRARGAGWLERRRIKAAVKEAPARFEQRAHAHALNVVRMDALLDQAREIERQVEALAAPRHETSTTTPSAKKRRLRSHQTETKA